MRAPVGRGTRAVTTTNIRASGTVVGSIIAPTITSQTANTVPGGGPLVPSAAAPSWQNPEAPARTSAAITAQHVPAAAQMTTAGSRPDRVSRNARMSAPEPERALDGVVPADRDVG